MFCGKCGAQLEDGTMFCPNCGAKVETEIPTEEVVTPEEVVTATEPVTEETVIEPTPAVTPEETVTMTEPTIEETVVEPVQEVTQEEPATVTEPVVEETITEPVQPVTESIPTPVTPVVEEKVVNVPQETLTKVPTETMEVKPQSTPVAQQTENTVETPKTETRKRHSVLWIVIPVVTAVLVLLIIFIIFAVSTFKNFFGEVGNIINDEINQIENNTQDGTFGGVLELQSCSINYSGLWSEVELSGGQTALEYFGSNFIITQVGVSNYSDLVKGGLDFETESGKKELHDFFLENWDEEMQENNMSVYKDLGKFEQFTTEGTYWTYFKYGKEDNTSSIKGKLYLIIDTEKDAVLSFMTNGDNAYAYHKDAEKLLKENLEIGNMKLNYIEDEEFADMIYQEQAWNKYASQRKGNLGKKKVLEGGWKVLSEEGQAYWVFKGNEFWWYKSYEDLSDNYWYGTFEYKTGTEGLKEFGLNEDAGTTLYSQSHGKITNNDIYCIEFTPKKIIADGEDLSDTNISGQPWRFSWILVDHGSEGIEAQTFNVYTYVSSYLVKLKD